MLLKLMIIINEWDHCILHQLWYNYSLSLPCSWLIVLSDQIPKQKIIFFFFPFILSIHISQNFSFSLLLIFYKISFFVAIPLSLSINLSFLYFKIFFFWNFLSNSLFIFQQIIKIELIKFSIFNSKFMRAISSHSNKKGI